MSAVRFVRVRLNGERRPIFLRVVRDTIKLLSGYEVDRDGDEIQPKGFERRLRVISHDLIKSIAEMELDKTFAVLRFTDALPPPKGSI